MKLKNIILIGAATMAFASCDDLFEPANENNQDISAMYKDADFARGVLDNAYLVLPYSDMPQTDLATDDAVSNDVSNNYKKMATGSWTAEINPVSRWNDAFHAIQYCNLMIANADKVEWSYTDESVNQMFIDNYLGNAYALRGLHHFYALRAHAGMAEKNGEILGIPMHLEYVDGNADFNEARLTFKECYDLIMADWNKALEYLPEQYKSISSSAEVPAKYASIGADMTGYNKAFGDHHRGKIDGRIIAAFKAQLAILAASPAYSKAGACTYAEAAQLAADCLAKFGGLDNMQSDGWKIFDNTTFLNNFGAADEAPAEIIWRANINKTQSYEKDNYPPSLFGSGRVNPTQNLVDAFPMANGMPITTAASGYDPNNPYEGRDPRLKMYILVNGSKIGHNNTVINTAEDSPTLDGINKENGKSTVTGYYMRKLLRSDVNCNDEASTFNHLQIRIRATELFLDYAEAANEAEGPKAKVGGAGYSAYDVIKAIRSRAGIGDMDINGNNEDPYLEECAASKEKMRELIRNERRLELCFENNRFWDLRRWLAPLNETAKGVSITTKADGTFDYKVIDVEKRDYKEYMYYCPIPYSEILKWSNLQQNYGW